MKLNWTSFDTVALLYQLTAVVIFPWLPWVTLAMFAAFIVW